METTSTVSKIVITPGADTLNALGATLQLSAQLFDVSGSQVSGSVKWTSLNNSIAGVDSLGMITARSLGVAVITAAVVCCNAADSISVTIRQIVASVVVTPGAPTVNVGSSIQLTAVPQDSSGNPVAGVGLSWTTSNAAVATVNSGGVVQGVSAGTAQVTATSQNESGSVNVTVSATAAPIVIGVVISPSGVTIPPNTQTQFGATAQRSDGTFSSSMPVTYSATGGTITPAGLYTAGSTTGTFRVVVTENSSGKADTAVVGIATSSGGFPAEYSLTRPLLASKPNALLAGEDWQDFTQTSQLNNHGFHVNDVATNSNIAASTVSVVHGPTGAKRAEIALDPTFGRAVRAWQTDTSDGYYQSVRYGRSFQSTTKAWYRVLVKYMPGFTNSGPGSAANSWKMFFGGYVRHVEWTNDKHASNFDGANQGLGPGSGQLLPNSPAPGQAWYSITNEWSSGEWYELIFYEERLSDNRLRHRRWARQLTFNNVINPGAPWTAKVGWLLTTTNPLPAGANGLQMGINRNKPMYGGEAQWWMWGPWEVIDGNVVPDPYGLANDML